jgi:hypothetical protein
MLKCRARHFTDDNIMLRSRDYISVPDSKGKNTDKNVIFNTSCFSAAKMATWRSKTLYERFGLVKTGKSVSMGPHTNC